MHEKFIKRIQKQNQQLVQKQKNDFDIKAILIFLFERLAFTLVFVIKFIIYKTAVNYS